MQVTKYCKNPGQQTVGNEPRCDRLFQATGGGGGGGTGAVW